LVGAIGWSDGTSPPGLRLLPGPGGQAAPDDGLATYRRNALASARRALAAAYPTVRALLGDEAMAALARDLWQAQPPRRGDLGHFGAGLPPQLQARPEYHEMPWLADVARLDWAVHRVDLAADPEPSVRQLNLLAEVDPAQLWLQFSPDRHWVRSDWPIAAIWSAHQPRDAAEQTRCMGVAQAALQAGQRDSAWVWRQAGQVMVTAEPDPDLAAFTSALWCGRSLGQALAERGPDFPFQQWLVRALQAHWLSSVRTEPTCFPYAQETPP
jgi:hypothetical protein